VRVRGWCGVVLAVSLTAACTESADSSGGPENSGGPDSGSAVWTAPSGPPPSPANRPAEVSVDEAGGPCELLTADQRDDLGLTGKQITKLSSSWSTNSCQILGADAGVSATVTPVSTSGIETFFEGRFAGMEYRRTEVRDFPALFYRFGSAPHACYLAVDIADGQLVDVAYGGSTDAPQDELCDTTHEIADAAVTTLLAAN
jgi:uncharacterized protein DUF3558